MTVILEACRRRSMKKLLVGAVLALSGAELLAQDPWPQEPVSILGIPFSGNIEQALPKCKISLIRAPSSPCFRRGLSRNDYSIDGHGLSFATNVSVETVGGKVESVTISGLRSQYHRAKQSFFEKYGEPHEREILTELQGGYAVHPEMSTWHGRNVVLSLDERAKKFDTWSFTATDATSIKQFPQSRPSATKSDADRL
jgi:hypothetical protein